MTIMVIMEGIKIKCRTFLSFDTWRKKGYKDLLQAYIKTFERSSEEDVKVAFKKNLDKYVIDGSGAYDGSTKDWQSAYIISRELAVYKENEEGKFSLSQLAQYLLESKITRSQYMANYILSFNQIINNNVINPFFEILSLIKDKGIKFEGGESIEVDEIMEIDKFNLAATSEKNRKKMCRSLCLRISDSELMLYEDNKLKFNGYKIDELKEYCICWEKSLDEFANLDQNQYVDLICSRKLVI